MISEQHLLERLHRFEQQVNPVLASAGFPPLDAACCPLPDGAPRTHGMVDSEYDETGRRIYRLAVTLEAGRTIIASCAFEPSLDAEAGDEWRVAQDQLVAAIRRALS